MYTPLNQKEGQMSHTFPLSVSWTATTLVTITFIILYPLVLAAFVRQRLAVGWKYFGFGALIFFLFQIISRIPLTTAIQVVLTPQLKTSPVLLYLWLGILAVTVGLFEEVGRYVGYRWLMRREEKTWSKAVMYGLGHGALKSILLVGGSTLVLFVTMTIFASNLDLVPVSQRATIMQQLQNINTTPAWVQLFLAWERLWIIPINVALSVMVLQVFRGRSINWLWLAVLCHAVVDGVSVALPQVIMADKITTGLIIEGAVAVFGLIAFWIIWQLRDRSEDAQVPIEQSPLQVLP